jgi:hypothetical protein
MDFEHLVQVNDPLNPLLDPLTRDQVWRGLLRRARDPVPFVAGLDRCEILEERENFLKRALHFGRLTFVDHVDLQPPDRVHYRSDAGCAHAGSELVVTIEEPGPHVLFVRFRYHTVSQGPADAETDAFRKEAYREADIATIYRIRQLAAHGELGPSPGARIN